VSGECCLAGACNCQSCMNEKINEGLQHSLSDNSRRLVQTSDNRTESALYLSDHAYARVDTSNQLDTGEDCKQSYSASDTEVDVESDQRSFTCKVCDRRFRKASEFSQHMRIHMGEKHFCCKVCEKKFARSSSLIKHKCIHTGEQAFSCEVCDKKFTQSGSLRAHMRSHTGERPYSCEVCDKTFTQLGHLRTHMRNHTGEAESDLIAVKFVIRSVQNRVT